jgi:hypothetical protein
LTAFDWRTWTKSHYLSLYCPLLGGARGGARITTYCYWDPFLPNFMILNTSALEHLLIDSNLVHVLFGTCTCMRVFVYAQNCPT